MKNKRRYVCKELYWKFNESFEHIHNTNSTAAMEATGLSQF